MPYQEGTVCMAQSHHDRRTQTDRSIQILTFSFFLRKKPGLENIMLVCHYLITFVTF